MPDSLTEHNELVFEEQSSNTWICIGQFSPKRQMPPYGFWTGKAICRWFWPRLSGDSFLGSSAQAQLNGLLMSVLSISALMSQISGPFVAFYCHLLIGLWNLTATWHLCKKWICFIAMDPDRFKCRFIKLNFPGLYTVSHPPIHTKFESLSST